ncbi:calcium uptake protein 3, mitochondrial-like isoform X1 [Lytechinus variegatus]|uniref:calcium uptake protein 3, mitochondrial-like isoform X1 n=1 Tax=Lytechinus variegatus TaxID=7654 RepID=UPI001BB2CC09|nr:calcium uptake protein 3, mitochondrial-like isoform X1 [Lytechinus variegatus]
MLKNTPSRKKSTKNLFRSIMDKGIVSYTEYLFLLCILTKPRAGYEIAFKMFDRDGNQRIDRKEFLLMEEIFRKKSQSSGESDSVSWLSHYATDPDSPASSDLKPGEVPLTDYMKSPVWDQLKINETTLLRYFFGPRGTDTLDYKTFAMFMDNLQTEVLELEFYEFSRGMPSIGEAEFANILLRYTHLEDAEMEEYVQRVRDRMPEEKFGERGISFESFTEFFQFINHLDDFEIVLRMYTFADQPITQAEFCRAVNVTTGQNLDGHIVHTVFQIFDKDGDGKLSQKEFLGVMKNRIHRGFREHLKKPAGWEGFKACVRKELKHNS